jgi:hypothetical protein
MPMQGPQPPARAAAQVGRPSRTAPPAGAPPVPPAAGMAPPPVGGKASASASVSVPASAPVLPPAAGSALPPGGSPPPPAAAARATARLGGGSGRHTGEQPALRMSSAEQPDLSDDLEPGPGYVPHPDRLRNALVLAAVAVLLLGVLPAILFFRASGSDPVFANLDGLALPGWAAVQHEDAASGSRLCVKSCRLRERTWRSTKPAKETDAAFETALSKAGWAHSQTAGCPKLNTGTYTCWQRDQYVLDLWTRDAACSLSGVAPSPGAPPPSVGPSQTAQPPDPAASGPPPTCSGALVTANIGEGIDPNWHH